MTDGRPRHIVLNPADNVAVALTALNPGTAICQGDIKARDAIPSGHKIAIKPIAGGGDVIKYGQIIGQASRAIQPGEHVHVDNLQMNTAARACLPGTAAREAHRIEGRAQAHFKGFMRPDGRAGTRNYIGVIASVSCSNSVAHFIADAVTPDILAAYPNVDGVVALGHGSGCCMAPGSECLDLLQRTIAVMTRAEA